MANCGANFGVSLAECSAGQLKDKRPEIRFGYNLVFKTCIVECEIASTKFDAATALKDRRSTTDLKIGEHVIVGGTLKPFGTANRAVRRPGNLAQPELRRVKSNDLRFKSTSFATIAIQSDVDIANQIGPILEGLSVTDTFR
jgi:hypothetical protein